MTDFFLIICVNLFTFLHTFFSNVQNYVFDLYQNIIDTILKILNIHVNFYIIIHVFFLLYIYIYILNRSIYSS